MTNDSPAKTSIASEFPVGYMLENLAVRADGSVLIAAVNRRQVWCVPAPIGKEPVAPVLLHTFDEGHLTMSFVEAEPDIFYVAIFGHPSLYRFDMRGWTPETAVTFTKAVEFEKPAGPNGAALLAPGVMLFSDSTEGLIWRVDLSEDGLHGKPSVWLKHATMASPGAGHKPVSFNNEMQVPFPGINGLYYGPKGNIVYYTNSAQSTFYRVAVDPASLEPLGDPEFLADVHNVDDLCVDEDRGLAYLTRHPDHTVERIPLPGSTSGLDRAVMAGVGQTVIGPTSIHWARGPQDYGRVAYVPTDGGTVELPPDGVQRPARLMRLELPA
jgi:hypothetical protein